MKRLLAGAALAAAFALPASAATIYTAPNDAGGLIRLTNEPARECREGERSGYSVERDGTTHFLCWRINDDQIVFLRWSLRPGTTSYPLSAFTKVGGA